MRRWRLPLSILTVCVLAASVASAQGPGGPGGRRGFGGMGRMMSLQNISMTLLRVEDVQKELLLEDEQKAGLQKIQEEMMAEMQKGFQDFQGLDQLSEEERNKKFQEAGERMEKLTNEARAKVDEILMPPQADRLRQIGIQAVGVMAFSDADVAKELALTEDQTKKFEELRNEMFQGFGRGGPGGQGGPGGAQGGGDRDPNETDEQRRARREERRKENEAKYMAVLTEEQKKKYEEMKGAKFDIDMRSLFRGPGGRGGRGRGGDGNNPAT